MSPVPSHTLSPSSTEKKNLQPYNHQPPSIQRFAINHFECDVFSRCCCFFFYFPVQACVDVVTAQLFITVNVLFLHPGSGSAESACQDCRQFHSFFNASRLMLNADIFSNVKISCTTSMCSPLVRGSPKNFVSGNSQINEKVNL